MAGGVRERVPGDLVCYAFPDCFPINTRFPVAVLQPFSPDAQHTDHACEEFRAWILIIPAGYLGNVASPIGFAPPTHSHQPPEFL